MAAPRQQQWPPQGGAPRPGPPGGRPGPPGGRVQVPQRQYQGPRPVPAAQTSEGMEGAPLVVGEVPAARPLSAMKPAGSEYEVRGAAGEVRRVDHSSKYCNYEDTDRSLSCLEFFVLMFAWIAVIVMPPLWCQLTRQVKDYERAVIFRLGKLSGGPQGPGVFIINPLTDTIKVVDLRVSTINLIPQQMMTKDSVTITVDAVAFMKVQDPIRTVLEVLDYRKAFTLFCATTLRAVIGKYELQKLLSHRDEINANLRKIIDDETDAWGVVVPAVEIKDVTLPSGMQRAMAAEAEAERERRAKIVNALGEAESARELANAAKIISKSPGAIQLRYLNTLAKIAEDENETFLFPLPLEMIEKYAKKKKR